MFRPLIIPVLAISLAGCVKFTDTLGIIQDAAVNARMSFQPVIDGICKELAQECAAAGSRMPTVDDSYDPCTAFEACDIIRSYIIDTFERIHMLIADANMSHSIGETKSAEEAVDLALALIHQIRDQLRSLGYLPAE